jgi:predicted dehydrogenase
MVKFAVVGLGHIGKRHAEMIRQNNSCQLVAVCDIYSKETIGWTDQHTPYFNNIADLLSSEIDIDVVNICTPNAYHADFALKCLENKHHVVIEKPIALTRTEAEKLVEKSNEVSRHVFCVMQNRYSPPSVWLKELIENKTLGNIYMVQLNCFWNRDERYYTSTTWHGNQTLDGGTLFTQFSHFIDIMYWLFGDISNINGRFRDFNHQQLTDFEDTGIVTFDFVKGGIGILNYSTSIWDKNLESSITIIGEKGTVRVAGQYMNEVTYCHVKDYVMPQLSPSSPPNDYGNYKGSAQNHHYVIQNVVDTLRQNGCVTTNVLEGLKVVDIIQRIYEVRNQSWEKDKQINN